MNQPNLSSTLITGATRPLTKVLIEMSNQNQTLPMKTARSVWDCLVFN